MEGRCRIGSKRGGQQSPQQLRGLRGNLAKDNVKQNVLAKQTSAKKKAHVIAPGTPTY